MQLIHKICIINSCVYLGGGEVSEQEARKRLIQENRNPSMTIRVKNFN